MAPSMMDLLERCLANKCFRMTARVVKWVPVLFVTLLSSWAYNVFVYDLCIMLVTNVGQRVALLVIFHILMIAFLWSYARVIFTPPARPPSKFYLPPALADELCAADNHYDYEGILDKFATDKGLVLANCAHNKGIRHCLKCACVKPDRSHHCSACGHCVLRFDHHCPWVNNCVGYSNYKFFLLFLFYGFYLCLFGVLAMLPVVLTFFHRAHEPLVAGSFLATVLKEFEMLERGKYQVLMLFLAAILFGLSLFCLLLYHLYLVAKNRSTVESFRAPVFIYGSDADAYNLGLLHNFQQVFGYNTLLWLLPIFTSPSNGYEFATRSVFDIDFTQVVDSEVAGAVVPTSTTRKVSLP